MKSVAFKTRYVDIEYRIHTLPLLLLPFERLGRSESREELAAEAVEATDALPLRDG